MYYFGVEKQIYEKQYQFKKVKWVKGEKRENERPVNVKILLFLFYKGSHRVTQGGSWVPSPASIPQVCAIHELVAEGQCQLSSQTVGSEVTKDEGETPTWDHTENWNLATCNRTKEFPVKNI